MSIQYAFRLLLHHLSIQYAFRLLNKFMLFIKLSPYINITIYKLDIMIYKIDIEFSKKDIILIIIKICSITFYIYLKNINKIN